MATNKVTTNLIDMSGDTGGLVWAKGTTAQRPTGVAGDLRLNTTDSRLEYKDNADWKRFSEGAATPTPDFQTDFFFIEFQLVYLIANKSLVTQPMMQC